jgi:hypothetical protein
MFRREIDNPNVGPSDLRAPNLDDNSHVYWDYSNCRQHFQQHFPAFRAIGCLEAFQMVGLVVAWRVFPMVVGPLFGLILKAVHPSLGYS